MNRIELMSSALRFYDDFFLHVKETNGPEAETAIKDAYYGIAAAGSAFMGYLLENFYNEPADLRHLFFTFLGSRGTQFGTLGVGVKVFKKSEIRPAAKGLLDMIDERKLDAFWKRR